MLTAVFCVQTPKSLTSIIHFKFHAKNHFQVNTSWEKKLFSFHKNFSQFSAGPIFRSGPNAAASIAPTLIRPCTYLPGYEIMCVLFDH